jgi:hypothetical protein
VNRRASAAVVSGIVVAALLTGCGKERLQPGEARLVVDGRTRVTTASKAFTVRGTRRLHRGDRVRVLVGTARVELSDDRSLELRRRSAITVQEPLLLATGDTLAKAASTALTVRTAMTDVVVTRGASRIVSSLAVRAGAYSGGLDVDSAGRRLQVPALRQAVVPTAGLVPDRPLPIAYDPSDAWDRRYLGEAIDLGAELANRSRGFAAQVPPAESSTAAFFRRVLPQLASEPAFEDATVEADRSPGETLVGAAIVVLAKRGAFAERWEAVFGFRDDGADWGLVAQDQGVDRTPLLDEIDKVITRATAPLAGPPPPVGPDSGPPPALPLGPPPPSAPPGRPTTTRGRTTTTRRTTTTSLPIPTVTIPNR